MRGKLTLTMDSSVVTEAKKLAYQKKASLSRIVEDYLRTIVHLHGGYPGVTSITAPITEGLVGMFPDDGKEYTEQLEEALSEKFL